MNSLDDDAIEKALCREFLGPSCLYKVLEQRSRENPFFLKRNLRKNKESPFRCNGILAGQTSLAINGQAVINFDSKVHFGRYTASLFLAIRQRGAYRVLGGKHSEEGDEEKATPLGSVNVPFKFEVDDRDLEGTECLFMAMFLTKNLKSRLTHRKVFEILLAKFEKEESSARLAMCDRLTDSIFPRFDPEYVSLIDLTSHLGPAKMQLGMEARKSTSVFRLFMDPLHRKVIHCELKHSQHCRLLNSSEAVHDPDSIPFNISLSSMLKASDPLHAWGLPRHSLSSTAVVRKSPPQRTEEIYQQPNSTLTFHYHIPKTSDLCESFSAAPNHFTWQESRDFLHCPWCQPSSRPSPVCVDPETRIPTAATLEAVCTLGQHLQACHHHFQFDFGYDFDGSLHILVTRSHDSDNINGLDMSYIIARNRKRKISGLHIREEASFYKDIRIRPIFLRYLEAKAVLDYEAFLASRLATSTATKETTSEEGEVIKPGVRKTGIVKGKKMDRRLKGQNFYGRSNRTAYFNALTGQPLTVDEVGGEDETQMTEFGQLHMRNQIIDEYSDITLQEKDFMKLWHEHLTTCPPYGDRLLPLVCEQFIEKFADSIVTLNLRHNLLLHLVNLWDFGLLLSEEVQAYMEFVDAYALSLAKGS